MWLPDWLQCALMVLHEQARRACSLIEWTTCVTMHRIAWIALELILVHQELGRPRASNHRRQCRCIVASREAISVWACMALALATMLHCICVRWWLHLCCGPVVEHTLSCRHWECFLVHHLATIGIWLHQLLLIGHFESSSVRVLLSMLILLRVPWTSVSTV